MAIAILDTWQPKRGPALSVGIDGSGQYFLAEDGVRKDGAAWQAEFERHAALARDLRDARAGNEEDDVILHELEAYANGEGWDETASLPDFFRSRGRALTTASEKNAELEAKLQEAGDEVALLVEQKRVWQNFSFHPQSYDLGKAKAKQELAVKMEAVREEKRLVEEANAVLARELADCRREQMEQKGVCVLAVRELLRPTPELEILRQVGRQGAAVALHEAELAAQHQETLATLSKIAESAGWQGEEPLAEWLEARLAGLEANGIVFGMDLLDSIQNAAGARGFSATGPQGLGDWLVQKLDRAALLDRVVALANAHGFASPFTLDADPTISLEDFLASKIAHNERIAHLHREQLRSLDTKLVQEGQRITLLKVRFQELRDLVAEALEI